MVGPLTVGCGKSRRYSVDEIVDKIFRDYDSKLLEVLSPLVKGKKGEYKNLLIKLRQQGYPHERPGGQDSALA